jgi:Kef-type K+ transport system membrane component KefB
VSTITPRARSWRIYLGFGALLAVAVAPYLWIRAYGESLAAPAAAPRPGGPDAEELHVLAHVLLVLAVVTFAARLIGGAFRRWLGQPPVIGEIVAGLLLGPSFLGFVWPAGYAYLLPSEVVPFLGILSKIGVVLFMFLVGMELDARTLRSSTHATVAISHASIVAPFLLGAVLALALYPIYAESTVTFTAFSLFLGVSLSVTAFPVLARILTDRCVQSTRLGVLAISCAAIGDVSAWSLLALVTGVIRSKVTDAALTVLWVLVFGAGMLLLARPVLRWLLARLHVAGEPTSRTALAVIFTALLLSAVATEAIGIHALFGAFLLGAIVPRDGDLREQVRSRMEDVVLVLLLPSFFAFTGMRTELGLVSGLRDWAACLGIIVVATLGKFGGSYLAARAVGIGKRPAAGLGLLMNTRGLMELIVLDLGMQMGLITPTLFTMLVVMALVTTFATTPLLGWVLGPRGFEEEPAPERTRV